MSRSGARWRGEAARAAGAAPGPRTIQVRIQSIGQFFHTLDPQPFRERDLDSGVEEYVVGWAGELSTAHPLEIAIHLPPAEAGEFNWHEEGYCTNPCVLKVGLSKLKKGRVEISVAEKDGSWFGGSHIELADQGEGWPVRLAGYDDILRPGARA